MELKKINWNHDKHYLTGEIFGLVGTVKVFLIKEMPFSYDVYNLLLHRMFAHKDSYVQARFPSVTKAKVFCQARGMDEIIEYFFEEKEKKNG